MKRLVALLATLFVSVSLWAQSGYIEPVIFTGKAPTGDTTAVSIDASGALILSGVSGNGVDPLSGYITPVAPVGLGVDGKWKYLNIDSTGALITTGTSGGGGAVFPSTSGLVWNTSTTASRNATSGDVTGTLGYTPVNKAGDNMTGAFSSPQINKAFQLDNFVQLDPNGCTVGGTAYTTPLECAVATADAWIVANQQAATLYLSSGSFNTVGQLLIPNTAFNGTLSLQGEGPQATQINLTGTISSGGVIEHPAGNMNRFHVRGLRVNAKYNAPYAIDLNSIIYTDMTDVIASGGKTADVEVPSGGTASSLYNVFTMQDGSIPQGHGAQFTPTITNGTLTGLALSSGNTGGSGYTPANTHINFYGTGSSVPDQPCTTLPTATPTFSGSTITGAAITSAGSGCTGTMYVSVFDGASTTYGIDIGAYDMTVYGGGAEEGITAGLHITGDSVKTYSFHPYYLPTEVWVDGAGGAKFYGMECDSPRHYCIEQSFYTEQYGTSLGWDGNGPYPGASYMHITNAQGRNFEATMTCANVQTGGGFNDFVDSGLGVVTAQDPTLQLSSAYMSECSPGNPVGTHSYMNTIYTARPKFVDTGTKNAITLQAPIGAVTTNPTEHLPVSGDLMGATTSTAGGTCTSTGYIPVKINGVTINVATCQ